MDFIISLDHSLLYFLNTTIANSWFDVFFPAITDLYRAKFFAWFALPLFIGLFYWKFKKRGIYLFVGLLLCLGCTDFSGHLIKNVVQRTRPADTHGVEVSPKSPFGGFSFMSNHATNMFALAAYTSFFIPETFGILYFLAFLISFSRVYNGVHFPIDVICGAIFGLIWALLFRQLFKKLFLSRPKANS